MIRYKWSLNQESKGSFYSNQPSQTCWFIFCPLFVSCCYAAHCSVVEANCHDFYCGEWRCSIGGKKTRSHGSSSHEDATGARCQSRNLQRETKTGAVGPKGICQKEMSDQLSVMYSVNSKKNRRGGRKSRYGRACNKEKVTKQPLDLLRWVNYAIIIIKPTVGSSGGWGGRTAGRWLSRSSRHGFASH